jgi:hypothetical protein
MKTTDTPIATGDILRSRAIASLTFHRTKGEFPTVRKSTLRTLELLPIEQPFTALYLSHSAGIALNEAREELEILGYALHRYAKGILQLNRERKRRHHIGRGGKPFDVFRLTLAPRYSR